MKSKKSDKKWGNPYWTMLHIAAINFNPKKKENFIEFVDKYITQLPCNYCRTHAVKNLKDLPPDNYVEHRRLMFLWSYLLHDIVNKQIGKTSPPFEEVLRYYEENYLEDCEDCKV